MGRTASSWLCGVFPPSTDRQGVDLLAQVDHSQGKTTVHKDYGGIAANAETPHENSVRLPGLMSSIVPDTMFVCEG